MSLSPESSWLFLIVSHSCSSWSAPAASLSPKDPHSSPKHSENSNSLTASTEDSSLTPGNYRAEKETSSRYQQPHMPLAFLITTTFSFTFFSLKHCSITCDQDRSSLLEGCPITSSLIPDDLQRKEKKRKASSKRSFQNKRTN